MNRKELYKKITELNLQEEVKKVCGRNYTQASNSVLTDVVNKAEVTKGMVEVAVEAFNSRTTSTDASNQFERLIKILSKKRILLKSEVEFIMK